jgi:hypothetical protein
MFQVPRLPPHRLYIQRWVTRHYSGGVAPFGNPRLRQLAADRGLSQQCHVLHRPSTPRHPPCALISLRRTQNKFFGPPPSACGHGIEEAVRQEEFVQAVHTRRGCGLHEQRRRTKDLKWRHCETMCSAWFDVDKVCCWKSAARRFHRSPLTDMSEERRSGC